MPLLVVAPNPTRSDLCLMHAWKGSLSRFDDELVGWRGCASRGNLPFQKSAPISVRRVSARFQTRFHAAVEALKDLDRISRLRPDVYAAMVEGQNNA